MSVEGTTGEHATRLAEHVEPDHTQLQFPRVHGTKYWVHVLAVVDPAQLLPALGWH